MTLGQLIGAAVGVVALVSALLAVGAEWGDMRRSVTEVRTTATAEHEALKAEIARVQAAQERSREYLQDLLRSRGTWTPLDPARYEDDR